MANNEHEDNIHKAIEACNTAQAMIDINAEHLDGLRTQCATSAELTQHEIRTLEVRIPVDGDLSQNVAKKKAPSFVYELHNDLALQLQSLSRCLFRQYLRLHVLPVLVE